MDELLTLPGVGRKTANIVMNHAYGINEGIAVDTHVRRVSVRIGFSSHPDPARIERDLMALFPKKGLGGPELSPHPARAGHMHCKEPPVQ